MADLVITVGMTSKSTVHACQKPNSLDDTVRQTEVETLIVLKLNCECEYRKFMKFLCLTNSTMICFW